MRREVQRLSHSHFPLHGKHFNWHPPSPTRVSILVWLHLYWQGPVISWLSTLWLTRLSEGQPHITSTTSGANLSTWERSHREANYKGAVSAARDTEGRQWPSVHAPRPLLKQQQPSCDRHLWMLLFGSVGGGGAISQPFVSLSLSGGSRRDNSHRAKWFTKCSRKKKGFRVRSLRLTRMIIAIQHPTF